MGVYTYALEILFWPGREQVATVSLPGICIRHKMEIG